MKELTIELKNIEHPYADEKAAYYDLWGHIKLSYGSRLLIDTQWNILGFIEWFSVCSNKLSYEIFPFKYVHSIVESRNILFSVDNFKNEEEEDQYYEKLEEYFQFHFLKLKGTNTGIFYIGLTKDSIGEISYEKDSFLLKYNFNMDLFISSTDIQIKHFLSNLNLENSQISYLKKTIPKYHLYFDKNERK